MTNTTCRIWGTPASEPPSFGGGHFMDSPRAGGKYFVSGTTVKMLESCDDLVKARLTSWLVEQRSLGIDRPKIYGRSISEARQRRDLQVPERADGILRYLETRTNILGDQVSYHVFIGLYDKSLPTPTEEEKEYLSLLAHSECIGKRDLLFFLDYLEQCSLIKTTGRDNKIKGCILTVEGYARLAELDRINADSPKAFVAMWFDGSMNDAWERGLSPGIREAGYDPVRIDRKEHVNKICDEIVAEIRRARFVVADFTHGDSGASGGVYYEAGFAHGLNIPVICTCRTDVFKDLHFDTRQFNHIEWNDPEELQRKLLERITAVIGDGPFMN